MSDTGEVVALWRKPAKFAPMESIDRAHFSVGEGMRETVDRRQKRQVTFLDEAAWARAEKDVGRSVDAGLRRANVLLRGIDLTDSIGRRLRLGEALVVIRGETVPCERMEEAQAGLREALAPEWRGGAYGEVIESGEIGLGTPVQWEAASD